MFKYILYSQNSADWPEKCCAECAARPVIGELLLILCIRPVAGYLPGHNVENLAGCHILSLVHNGRNPGALLHIVLQFALVESSALGLFGLQGLQALSRHVGQLRPRSTKRLVQIVQLQWRSWRFTEDGRKCGQLQTGQWNLKLRLDYLQGFVLDVQLLVGVHHVLEQAITQSTQVHVEHLLEVRRHLGANGVDQAGLGHIGQEGQVREVLVVTELGIKSN